MEIVITGACDPPPQATCDIQIVVRRARSGKAYPGGGANVPGKSRDANKCIPCTEFIRGSACARSFRPAVAAGGASGAAKMAPPPDQVLLPVSVHCEGISMSIESPLNSGVRRTSRSIDVADIV